jgi:hypothetical protein
LKQKLQQLNILGLLALFPGIVCLCLALQWGGTTYAVSSRSELASAEPHPPVFGPAELIGYSGVRDESSHCSWLPLYS